MAVLELCIPSAQAMVELGRILGELVRPGDVVALVGDLGVGKTTLVQGIAQGLDIQELVTSPTFTLIKDYASGRLNLHHIDVYRLEDPEEILHLGLDELLWGEGVVVLEWADRILSLLPEDYLEISITRHVNIRKAVIEPRGKGYEGLVEELREVAGSRIG